MNNTDKLILELHNELITKEQEINRLKEEIEDCNNIICGNVNCISNIRKDYNLQRNVIKEAREYINEDKNCVPKHIKEYFKDLLDKVEIIEEEKKIPEKIDIWYDPIKDTELERHDTNTSIEILANMCDDLKDKYNEIIDYLNKENKE